MDFYYLVNLTKLIDFYKSDNLIMISSKN